MHPLEKLATVFFNIFGITQPSPSALGKATWFLMAMLALVAIAVATGGWVVYHLMHVV